MSTPQRNQLGSYAADIDFAALSTAASLPCLCEHSVAIAEAYAALLDDIQQQGNEQELISSFRNTSVQLAAAVRRAFELLGDVAVLQGGSACACSLAGDYEVPGCLEARYLMALLGQRLIWSSEWLSGEPLRLAECTQLKIAQDIASSGLLPSLARLCDKVSATVTQQQQEQQQLHLEVGRIAHSLVEFVADLFAHWPGKWFSGRTLAPVLPSLLRLLVTAACACSSSRLDEGSVAYQLGVASQQLTEHIRTELRPVADAVRTGQLNSMNRLPLQTVDILRSHAVQHLILTAVASLVAQLHNHRMSAGKVGTSSGTEQQQQVAKAHEELYRAVGLRACVRLTNDACAGRPEVISAMIRVVSASVTVLICQEAVQGHSCINSTDTNSSAKRSAHQQRRQRRQQQQEMLAQLEVGHALLLVAVEVLELNPGDIGVAGLMLLSVGNLYQLLKLQLRAATLAAEAASRLPGSAAAAYPPEGAVLTYINRSFEVALLQLVPAVTQSLRMAAGSAGGAGSSNDNSGSSSNDSDEASCRRLLWMLLRGTVTPSDCGATGDDIAVLKAYRKNPVITLSSLEVGLRLLATEKVDPTPASQKEHNHKFLMSYLETLVVVLELLTVEHSVINKEAQQQQQQQKLISLGISMLKCCKRLASDHVLSWQLVGLVGRVLGASCQIAATAADSSNPAGTGSPPASTNSPSASGGSPPASSGNPSASTSLSAPASASNPSAGTASTPGSNPPASISTVAAGGQAPRLVFVGRCLLLLADLIHAKLSTGSSSDQMPTWIAHAVWVDIKTTLPRVTAAVQLQHRELAAQVCLANTSATAVVVAAAAAKTLQQQAGVLQDSLAGAHDRWQEILQQPLPQAEQVLGSHGTADISPEGHASENLTLNLLKLGFGASGEVAQQLSDFAAAVCAAVPVPCCCNNHGCDNMFRFSDSELVGGKSCVCAGCEVARYCGSQCQAAHWQQHKAACKRIKASKKGRIVG